MTSQKQATEAVSSNRGKWLALALLCVVQFMVVLDIAIVNVALPSIQSDLGFSQEDLQWVISAYALVFGGFLLLGGRAADMLGRRRIFVLGTIWFAAAPTHAQDSLETAVKATYLYKFAPFVTWPQRPGPFVICVVGRDPFGPVLDQAVAGQRAGELHGERLCRRSRRGDHFEPDHHPAASHGADKPDHHAAIQQRKE